MEKELIIFGELLTYTLKVSSRAKRVSIVIQKGGKVSVTMPKRVKESDVIRFVEAKAVWISTKVKEFQSMSFPEIKELSPYEMKKQKAEALVLVTEKLKLYNAIYGFIYGKVTIKKQTTLWGSCSRKGNLNFNVALGTLPERLLEYVVVHELCHLQEFNHGKGFWSLVEKTIPDHKALKQELQKLGRVL
jgi:predicted metal-dependent hydrolase